MSESVSASNIFHLCGIILSLTCMIGSIFFVLRTLDSESSEWEDEKKLSDGSVLDSIGHQETIVPTFSPTTWSAIDFPNLLLPHRSIFNFFDKSVRTEFIADIRSDKNSRDSHFSMFKAQIMFNDSIYYCERVNINGNNFLSLTSSFNRTPIIYGHGIEAEDPRLVLVKDIIYIVFGVRSHHPTLTYSPFPQETLVNRALLRTGIRFEREGALGHPSPNQQQKLSSFWDYHQELLDRQKRQHEQLMRSHIQMNNPRHYNQKVNRDKTFKQRLASLSASHSISALSPLRDHRSIAIVPYHNLHNLTYLNIRGVPRKEIEKNWTPFEKDGQLYLVYSLDPLAILRYDFNVDGWCDVIFRQDNVSLPDLPTKQFFLRGGSNFIPYYDDFYIGAAHSRVAFPNTGKYMYFSHIVILDTKLWQLRYLSKPLRFYMTNDILVEMDAQIRTWRRMIQYPVSLVRIPLGTASVNAGVSSVSNFPSDPPQDDGVALSTPVRDKVALYNLTQRFDAPHHRRSVRNPVKSRRVRQLQQQYQHHRQRGPLRRKAAIPLHRPKYRQLYQYRYQLTLNVMDRISLLYDLDINHTMIILKIQKPLRPQEQVRGYWDERVRRSATLLMREVYGTQHLD